MDSFTQVLVGTDPNVTSFLADLATVSHKHQLGLTGEITVFIMEKDEFGLAYAIDSQSNLKFTSA